MTQHNKHLPITEKNLKAAFEHARKLMNAVDVNEVMHLQAKFLRSQFGRATEQHSERRSTISGQPR
jgi:hypothetical protein